MPCLYNRGTYSDERQLDAEYEENIRIEEIPQNALNTKMNIAFATYAKDGTPEGFNYSMSGDDSLAEELRVRGFTATSLPWDQPEVDWTQFNAVILRRTWDYHLHYEKFLAWLNDLEKKGVTVLNPIHVLRWNSKKTYLSELKDRGANIIDTVFVECQSDVPSLISIMVESGWTKAVFKPVVGISGHQVHKVLNLRNATDKQSIFEKMVRDGHGVLVQEYMESVDTSGEVSLVYLNGKYSHALWMKPRSDSSRGICQGNDVMRLEPDLAALATADDVMKALPWKQPPVYARVDVIEDSVKGGYALMEVEMVEPQLYLEGHSVIRMANLIEHILCA
ncbi:hypothetical protein CAPTEDRAFT_216496 [Capitella teleta]|uniref:Uncharacterized protein n=1 Tax=Capitella teleta TaxID=283909 RepID=R7TEP7_CAPTE|nr:hypothetical protein CAPTEDRAFT_216496 [Capitella teleta]|eukprot:ELT91962.1 hypothetical protein CAPTEDRAFT_216496 [Capitella teleta]